MIRNIGKSWFGPLPLSYHQRRRFWFPVKANLVEHHETGMMRHKFSTKKLGFEIWVINLLWIVWRLSAISNIVLMLMHVSGPRKTSLDSVLSLEIIRVIFTRNNHNSINLFIQKISPDSILVELQENVNSAPPEPLIQTPAHYLAQFHAYLPPQTTGVVSWRSNFSVCSLIWTIHSIIGLCINNKRDIYPKQFMFG